MAIRFSALAGFIALTCSTAFVADASASGRNRTDSAPQPRPSGLEAAIGDTPRFFSMADVLNRRQSALAGTLPSTTNGLAPASSSASIDGTKAVRAGDMGEPFGAHGYRMFSSSNRAVTSNWQAVLRRWNEEKARLARCAALGAKCNDAAAKEFGALVEDARRAPGDRIALVNERINARIRYMADATRHGTADVWSTPLTVLGSAGDCEDYAIAKYMALREAGMPEDHLRLVLLRDRRAGEDHAVLTVRQGDNWLVLDNRWSRIDDDRDMAHYRPVFALKGQQVSLFAAPYVGIGPSGIDLGSISPALGEDAPLELSVLGVDWDLRPSL